MDFEDEKKAPEPEMMPIEPAKESRLMFLFRIVLILIVVLSILSGPLLQLMGNYLVLRDDEAKADLIVVLAGSPVVRSLAAAEYYNRGLGLKLWVSRGGLERSELLPKMDASETGNWGLSRKIMITRGVPSEAVFLDSQHVASTIEEAFRVKEYLKGKNYKSLILVTSEFHSRRACLTFEKVLGSNIKIISLPSRYDPFEAEGWWRRRADAKHCFMEYQKLVFFFFEYAFGDEEE